MKKLHLYLGLLKIPTDLLAIVLGFLSAYHFRLTSLATAILPPVTDTVFYGMEDKLVFSYAVPFAIYLIIILAYNQLYAIKKHHSLSNQFQQVLISIIFWLGTIISYFFFIRSFPFSRFVLVGAAFFSFTYLCFGRIIIDQVQKFFLRRGVGTSKVVLIVNTPENFSKVKEAIDKDLRFQVVGYVANSKIKNTKLQYFGNFTQFEQQLATIECDDLVQIGEFSSNFSNKDLMEICRANHKEYWLVPEILQVRQHNLIMAEINGVPLFKVKPTPLDGWGKILKRAFDLVFSTLGLLILAPFFAIIAILIKLDSKGPILFKHTDDGKIIYRIGQKGKPFYCYKFRTMHPNTHSQRYTTLAEQDIRKGSPLVKIKNDPRITRLGHFLRRFDIDELPQLWNVFIGNMSLIGPRPHLIEEVDQYQKHHKFVLTVKPGISGLSQVNGRSDLDFEDEVKLDAYYIENWSLLLDLKILVKTVLIVFKGHGEFQK